MHHGPQCLCCELSAHVQAGAYELGALQSAVRAPSAYTAGGARSACIGEGAALACTAGGAALKCTVGGAAHACTAGGASLMLQPL